MRGAKRAAGACQFIAGGKHADLQARAHRKPRLPQSGGQPNLSGAEPFALRQRQHTGGDILTCRACIGARLKAGGNENHGTVAADIFLHHGGIGAGGHGGTGENAHGFTGGQGARRSLPSGDAANLGERGLGPRRQIRMAKGPAIHGGVEEGRQGQRRH